MKRTTEVEPAPQPSGWRGYLDVAATVAVILVSLAVTWAVVSARLLPPSVSARGAATAANRTVAALPTEPIQIGQGPVKGRLDAKVALIEYSDFQCPFCARFAHDTLPALDQKYMQSGRVLFSFQEAPLKTHPFAQRAAEAAECANRQGRFWEMHDVLFAKQSELAEPLLLSTAHRVGMNTEIFAYCLDGEAAPFVVEQAAVAMKLGVSGTPTFFVGTLLPDGRVKVAETLSGAQPLARFEQVLDRLLETQAAGQK